MEGSLPWFCTLEEKDWPVPVESIPLIRSEFSGPWGDRQQEIVFIGENLDSEAITELLDSCLLNDNEMKKWEKVVRKAEKMEIAPEMLERKLEKVFEDGWEDWATSPLMGEGDGHEGHNHP